MEVTAAPAPAPATLGESLAHVSRAKRWTIAVFSQICMPVGFTLLQVYCYTPSFFTSVPWRLPLLLSWSTYLSLYFMIESYAQLFLPRTPLAVVDNIRHIGLWGVGLVAIGMPVSAVFATEVKDDTRVLAACFGVAAAFNVGLVAVWVWLARKYGGDGDSDALESSSYYPDS